MNAVVLILQAAIEQFGPPSTWHRLQVTAWVRDHHKRITGREAPTTPKQNVVPFVPADEREALSTEDGWK